MEIDQRGYRGKDISSHYSKLHEWDTAEYHLYDLQKDPHELSDLAGFYARTCRADVCQN